MPNLQACLVARRHLEITLRPQDIVALALFSHTMLGPAALKRPYLQMSEWHANCRRNKSNGFNRKELNTWQRDKETFRLLWKLSTRL